MIETLTFIYLTGFSLQSLYFNEKTDVWSFGVTCYEVFAGGKTLYAGIRNADLMDQLKWGYRLPPVPSMPRRVYNLCRSSWEKKQEVRWNFDQLEKAFKTLADELAELLNY